MKITSAKMEHLEKETNWNPNMNDLVKSASRVIAPLSPINIFAARSPWAGLEELTFEEVARKLKGTCDVDIYPDDLLIVSAWKRGEIEQEYLEKVLQDWLDRQDLHLPRNTAKQFCLSALLGVRHSKGSISELELRNTAKKLSGFQSELSEKQSLQTCSKQIGEEAVQELNRHMIKWCKLFLDQSQAVWGMPDREKGFYHSWRKLAPHDPNLNKKARRLLNRFPKEAESALNNALSFMGIAPDEVQLYLEAHLLELPGWSGMMLWRSQQSSKESSLLTEYLAVRLSMESALFYADLPVAKKKNSEKVFIESLILKWKDWGGFPIHAWSQLPPPEQTERLTLAFRFDKVLRHRLWLQAWEKTHEARLMNVILAKRPFKQEKTAVAQLAFCIDVRSEPFRRKLEKTEIFETIGTAGFFGLPIETSELAGGHTHNSLPVMFKPQYKVKESTPETVFKQFQQRREAAASLKGTFQTMKHNLLTSMVLPEISGPWLSLQTLMRSFVPKSTGSVFRKLREIWLKKPDTKLSIHREHSSETGLPVGFSVSEQVHYARQALKMMGLTDHFAPLVVICGHGSQSINNPYASALDCGACGGKSSAINARVLAELCNLSHVRKSLAAEGIAIPKDTVFAAAEHVTTVDELRWVYVPKLSELAQKAFDQLQEVLPEVRNESITERIQKLPTLGTSKNPQKEVKRMSEDWSEVRPEWGLTGNAAFIIGQRSLTISCNLEGRVFLQNYNWEKDESGELLAKIIVGPATVAQWINLQYYASTVAPHYYGSGNKATQTVTAGLGVMQGNGSDLLSGLPWQSVMRSHQEAGHDPLRLLVVIQAPRVFVERLLENAPEFRRKIQNGWIRLASIDPAGNWKSWTS